jgi:hypothetical protein
VVEEVVVVEARAGGAVVEVVGARVGGATEEVVGAGGGGLAVVEEGATPMVDPAVVGATAGDMIHPTAANCLAMETGGSPAAPLAWSLRQLRLFGGDQIAG